MPTLTNFFHWLTRVFLPNAIFTLFIVYLVLTYQQVTAQTGNDSTSNPPLVTSTFAYQGFLTNTTGQPINGNRALTFRLYSGASGGQPLWVEVRNGQNSVDIENGLFDVRLGEITPIPTSVWDTPTLYLGVQVEAEAELSPREALGLVPVAQRSLTSDLALSVPDGSITSNKLNPTTGRTTLNSGIVLTTQMQTILETSVNVSHPARLLVIPTLDILVDEGIAAVEVIIANQPQVSFIMFGSLSGGLERGTVSNSYLVNVPAGNHEIILRGFLTGGTGDVAPGNTGLTYIVVSQ